MKFSAKLCLAVFIVMSLALGSSSLIVYFTVSQQMADDVRNIATIQGRGFATEIEDYFDKLVIRLQNVAEMEKVRTGDSTQILAAADEFLVKKGFFDSSLTLSDENGNAVTVKGDRFSIADREHHLFIKENKKPFVTNVLIAKATGKPSVIVAVPIFDMQGKYKGLLGGVYPLDELNKIVAKAKIGQTGWGYILDTKGTLVVSAAMPELAGIINVTKNDSLSGVDKKVNDRFDPLLGQSLSKLSTTATQYIEYTEINNSKTAGVLSALRLPGQTWALAVVCPANEMDLAAVRLLRILIGVSVVSILVGFVLLYWVSRQLVGPLLASVNILNGLATGDFRQKIGQNEIKRSDEAGMQARAIDKLISNLRALFSVVQQKSELVSAASEQLSASAEQSAQATNQVAESISGVAEGVVQQAGTINHAAKTIEQMAENVQQVTINANSVTAISEQASNAAQKGGDAINAAISQMNNIEKTVETSAAVVSKLGERSKEIGQIVNTISGIAGQTNLLALNAAIEAARAGEQGRGFAVVADEVRKLAEQSQEAAKQIASLIHEIQGDTDQAIVAMNEGTKEVKIGTTVVGSAGSSFKDILELNDRVSLQVKEISSAIQQLATRSREIVAAISQIEQVSQSFAGQTETVSAATEEQAASMEQIGASSQDLAKLAEDLLLAVNKFKM